jgi:hypothetical protein
VIRHSRGAATLGVCQREAAARPGQGLRDHAHRHPRRRRDAVGSRLRGSRDGPPVRAPLRSGAGGQQDRPDQVEHVGSRRWHRSALRGRDDALSLSWADHAGRGPEITPVICQIDNAAFDTYLPDRVTVHQGGPGDRIADGKCECRFAWEVKEDGHERQRQPDGGVATRRTAGAGSDRRTRGRRRRHPRPGNRSLRVWQPAAKARAPATTGAGRGLPAERRAGAAGGDDPAMAEVAREARTRLRGAIDTLREARD